jgi:hypothetical protein
VSPQPLRYSLRGIGLATVVAVSVSIAVSVLTDLFPLVGVAMVGRARDAQEPDIINLTVLIDGLLATVSIVPFLVAGVLAIIWLYRARTNLDSWGGVEPGMSAGWAIGGWFIPLGNLVIPFRVTAHVARASLRLIGTPVMVVVWWIAYVLNQCSSVVLARLDQDSFGGLPLELGSKASYQAYVDYYRTELGHNAVGVALVILSGVLFCLIVRRISAAQHERADALLGGYGATPVSALQAVPTVPPQWHAGRPDIPDRTTPLL